MPLEENKPLQDMRNGHICITLRILQYLQSFFYEPKLISFHFFGSYTYLMLSNSFEKHRRYDSLCFQWYDEATCASHGSLGHELAEFYTKYKPHSLFPTPPQLLTNTWY